ncbi:MAG: lysylphosphatidylglycerol synthase transmembrane domain-containing protein [Myxococcales bacterium]|nr:lysylphosphatidylglycerol synthase transmembrane domain-containing protein [Myxococcales bacterium]
MIQPRPSAAGAVPLRRLVRGLVVATVLGALVFGGLALWADASQMMAALRRLPFGALVLAVALATVNYALRFVRWQYYLHLVEVRVPVGESLLAFLAAFVGGVTPGKLGETLKALMLYESRGAPIARTAPLVVSERLTDLVALVLLTAAGAGAVEGGWIYAAVGAVVAGLLLLVVLSRPLADAVLGWLERMPGLRRIGPRLREAHGALRDTMAPGPLLLGTFVATVAWAFEVESLRVLCRGLGVQADVQLCALAYGASTLAGAVAMMPGGLGVTEAGMAGLLEVAGRMDRAVASAATALCRLATLWWAVLLGLVAYLAFVRRGASRPSRVAAPATDV